MYHKVSLEFKMQIGLTFHLNCFENLLLNKEGIFNINAKCNLYFTISIEFNLILNLQVNLKFLFSWFG